MSTLIKRGILQCAWLESNLRDNLREIYSKNGYKDYQIDSWLIDCREVRALNTYLKETIELTFKGKDEFTKNYPHIKKKAMATIEIDHELYETLRWIGNIITVALATIFVVGLGAMAVTSKSRGGFLLFRSSTEDTLINTTSNVANFVANQK